MRIEPRLGAPVLRHRASLHTNSTPRHGTRAVVVPTISSRSPPASAETSILETVQAPNNAAVTVPMASVPAGALLDRRDFPVVITDCEGPRPSSAELDSACRPLTSQLGDHEPVLPHSVSPHHAASTSAVDHTPNGPGFHPSTRSRRGSNVTCPCCYLPAPLSRRRVSSARSDRRLASSRAST